VKPGWQFLSGSQCEFEGKVVRHRAYFPDTLPRWENSQQETKAMTKILDEVLAANAKYAENFGDKGNLPLPPSGFPAARSSIANTAPRPRASDPTPA
jgi:hypothetical protein